MKTLIIAEKPSVATDLARVFDRVPKKGDHYENDELVISSAVGHLVELCMPEEYDKKLGSWSLKNLPILPDKFKLKPIKRNEDRFKQLKKLLGRKDVSLVVNACDAGREGELIFTYLYEQCKCKLPVKRLWMLSMTPQAIKEAYEHMKDGAEMENLAAAARCRSEADWLIGINGTRGATIRMGARAGAATSIGRVQTPTLTMIVEREIEIRNFKPRKYWRIEGQFQITKGDYSGVLQRAEFKKDKSDEHDKIDRIWDQKDAQAILDAALAQPQATVTEEKKRSKQSSQRLYDLTSLQREANGRFGFPAGRTLSIAQSLYEKHKMITYPRTDSRALPEDYGSNVIDALRNLGSNFRPIADKVLENNWVNPSNKRIFNNKQVSDHFAIIPTDQSVKKLSDDEYKIYDMIVRRFIAIFYPPAEFDVTTRMSEVASHQFKTEGKVLIVPGYLEVYGKGATADTLPPLAPEDGSPAKGTLLSAEVIEEETKPPPRYSEATLLSAMEGAGKLVDDEELAEAMKDKGLGTPATRAQTIEHLIYAKYIERQGRELAPLQKAETLLQFLHAFDLDEVSTPELTGEWEYKLHQIEDGKYSREEFMKEIRTLTKKIAHQIAETEAPRNDSDIVSFTNQQPLEEDFRGYYSKDSISAAGREVPNLVIYKTIGNRRMSKEEIRTLLEKRELGPLDGFRSKAGKAYSAVLKLAEKENGTYRIEFVFDGNGENGEDVDLSKAPVIGKCPLCGANIHEATQSYVCEKQVKDKSCKFRVSRNLLGKTIDTEQMKKLLEEGKTDLIKGFRSNRTKRLFDAFLIKDDKRGFGFEFPPRPKKKSAKKKAAKKKTTSKS